MKNSKKTELNFTKLKVSNLQNIVGGRSQELTDAWHTDACNSHSERCSSQNTRFTAVVSCCSSCPTTNMKC